MMQEDFHRFLGVRRGTHPIKLNGDYLWDAHNIRFENKEDGAFLSITNETEPQSVPGVLFPQGAYIGHCILDKYLVVFIHGATDYIYKVYKENGNLLTRPLFRGTLNLDPNHPVLTLGVYENDLIQKVYWTDGINQPRYINVVDNTVRTKPSDVDFVAELTLGDSIEVTDKETGGLFAPGVIQYAITYYNKYGAETSIVYTSPLHYIHPSNRGAKADELVLCSFSITVTKGSNTDLDNFDYIRIYSIHRTSLDAKPTVKQVADVLITDKSSYTIVDSGYIGELVDSDALLYIGGEELLANCIEAKDNTLFLGDIKHMRMEAFKPYKEASTLSTLRDSIIWAKTSINKKANDDGENHLYGLPGLMFDSPCFKHGEWYRCGIQLLYKNGKWSEPIFLKDTILNTVVPFNALSIIQGSLRLTVPREQTTAFYNAGFRRIRTCVVFPSVSERKIITLGIVAPTVFNVLGRNSEAPYSLASWFFRPKNKSSNPANTFYDKKGSYIQFLHNKPLFVDTNSARNSGAEIQGATAYGYNDTIPGNAYLSTFFVDENIVTMHSPDIEWDETLANLGYNNTSFNAIGIACLDAVFGTSEILVSTATINPKASGLTPPKRNYTTNSNVAINGGLVTANCFVDSLVKDDKDHSYDENVIMTFPVYPWHRSGSLNNDSPGATARTRSAVLSKKCIGNLKYFKYNLCNIAKGVLNPIPYVNIGEPVYVNSSEVTLNRVRVPHLMRECSYEGNIDTAITHLASSYPLIVSPKDGYISESNDPIRMKYKSSPHLVFSLGHKYYGPSYPSILPIAADVDGTEADLDGNQFILPSWDETTNTGNTGGEDVVTSADDHIAYIIKEITPNPPSPPIPGDGLIYCPSNGSSTNSPYLRFWRGRDGTYVQEDLTDRVITLGYSSISAEGNRIGVTRAYMNSGINTNSSFIILNKCDAAGNKTGTINIGQYLLPSTTESYWVWKEDAPQLTFKIHGTGANLMFEPVVLASAEATSIAPLANDAKLFTIDLPVLTSVNAGDHSYMIIGELQREQIPTFGGNSEEALQLNLWVPSSDSVLIPPSSPVSIPYKYGDTWVSRYDCLKTYPFTLEDENLIVEIGSFLLESRVNMDGRCDRNRGNLSITNMSPLNFNLFNPVYNLLNNFFNYRIFDKDYYDQVHWLNLITWSQEKFAASHIDPWTLITLTNVQDLDGDKGAVTSIVNYNDILFYFLEHAFGLILFNSRVQIPASDGVPIEISNGLKVDGVRAISNTIGCQDKWAIVKSPAALYFVDLYTKTLWSLGKELLDFSTTQGLSYWFKKNCSTSKLNWNINNGIRLGYDLINQDVYFATGLLDSADTLCYSEKLTASTGSYDYTGVPPFVWEGEVFSLRDVSKTLKLFKHNVSRTSAKDPSITFISNANPNLTKIFDTLEFRGDVMLGNLAKNMLFPFNRIEVENEYLKGSAVFDTKSLRKKFRIWRALFPRITDTAQGSRPKFARARVRNPWVKVKLTSESDYLGNSTLILHDMSVKYTI